MSQEWKNELRGSNNRGSVVSGKRTHNHSLYHGSDARGSRTNHNATTTTSTNSSRGAVRKAAKLEKHNTMNTHVYFNDDNNDDDDNDDDGEDHSSGTDDNAGIERIVESTNGPLNAENSEADSEDEEFEVDDEEAAMMATMGLPTAFASSMTSERLQFEANSSYAYHDDGGNGDGEAFEDEDEDGYENGYEQQDDDETQPDHNANNGNGNSSRNGGNGNRKRKKNKKVKRRPSLTFSDHCSSWTTLASPSDPHWRFHWASNYESVMLKAQQQRKGPSNWLASYKEQYWLAFKAYWEAAWQNQYNHKAHLTRSRHQRKHHTDGTLWSDLQRELSSLGFSIERSTSYTLPSQQQLPKGQHDGESSAVMRRAPCGIHIRFLDVDDANEVFVGPTTTANETTNATAMDATEELQQKAVVSGEDEGKEEGDVVGKNEGGVPVKYWMQRYRLFSLFDKGMLLDSESWFSVTPEKIATHHAFRCECDVIVDGFCGVGGDSIQFAKTCQRVIAIDIDPKKIQYAKHNAKVYGVAEKIDFVVGDFFQVMAELAASPMRIDVVYLSPPWGGPSYLNSATFAMDDVSPSIRRMVTLTRSVTPNFALFLPRNTALSDILSLFEEGEKFEVEQNCLNHKLKSITVYSNQLADVQ